MLGSEGHFAHAQRIEAFVDYAGRSPAGFAYQEWVAIALFYSALHYVEAFLVTRAPTYRDHLLRRAEMRKHPETRVVLDEYHLLEQAAHEARYDGTPFNQGNLLS